MSASEKMLAGEMKLRSSRLYLIDAKLEKENLKLNYNEDIDPALTFAGYTNSDLKTT